MQLIISFSGRVGGNCDELAAYIAATGDKLVYFRDLDVHACSGCSYECFSGDCPYREDDVFALYEQMTLCERVVMLVPIYCGNPSSLFFLFNERSQDFFMTKPECYLELAAKLYFIGVYGSEEESPDFLRVFTRWFDGEAWRGHVLGLERHRFGQRLQERLLELDAVKELIDRFLQ